MATDAYVKHGAYSLLKEAQIAAPLVVNPLIRIASPLIYASEVVTFPARRLSQIAEQLFKGIADVVLSPVRPGNLKRGIYRIKDTAQDLMCLPINTAVYALYTLGFAFKLALSPETAVRDRISYYADRKEFRGAEDWARNFT